MNSLYEGYKAYTIYISIRSHFTTDYDYFKYSGKVRVTSDSFLKRRDRFFFAKLQRKYSEEELKYYFVANFVSSQDVWSGNLTTLQSEKIFLDWKKKAQSLRYHIEQEFNFVKQYIERYDMTFNELFNTNNGHPILLKLLLKNKISIETVVVINKILNFVSRWNKVLREDIVWEKEGRLVEKYSPFLEVQVDTYRKIMQHVFISS